MADAAPTTTTAPVPATGDAAHHYHFDIAMSCGGCSGAVDRVLKKVDGM